MAADDQRRREPELCRPDRGATVFPEALATYANIGRSIFEAVLEYESGGGQPAVKQKIGRNEPCPCGSGKKYKQCCGRQLH